MNAILEVQVVRKNATAQGAASALCCNCDGDLRLACPWGPGGEGFTPPGPLSGGSRKARQWEVIPFPVLQRGPAWGIQGPPRDRRHAPPCARAPSQDPVTAAPRDAVGFERLYSTYWQRVYRQCLRMVRNQADAEDLTQEVFLRLFQKVSTFRGESRFSTWLHRVTFNLVLMQLRRQRRRAGATASLDPPAGAEKDGSRLQREAAAPGTPSTSIFDRVSLDSAIAQLSTRYREVFLLHDVEGYGHEEIAKRLGISEGTSKSQLHKARQRLRVLLDESSAGNLRGVSHSVPRATNSQRLRCHTYFLATL